MCGFTYEDGPIAQRLEQGTHNPLVPGSNPGGPSPESFRGCHAEVWGAHPPRVRFGKPGRSFTRVTAAPSPKISNGYSELSIARARSTAREARALPGKT